MSGMLHVNHLGSINLEKADFVRIFVAIKFTWTRVRFYFELLFFKIFVKKNVL